MRVNVYSQELTDEVVEVVQSTEGPSGEVVRYRAARLYLESSPLLHHTKHDDDRSAVTFWLPKSSERRERMALAFERIASVFRGGDSLSQPSIPGIDLPPDPEKASIPGIDHEIHRPCNMREETWLRAMRAELEEALRVASVRLGKAYAERDKAIAERDKAIAERDRVVADRDVSHRAATDEIRTAKDRLIARLKDLVEIASRE